MSKKSISVVQNCPDAKMETKFISEDKENIGKD